MSSLATGARIELHADGFRIVHRGKFAGEIHWSDIVGIGAFKRDIWSVDEICLRFLTSADTLSLDVTEHDEGYEELLAEVERRYPDYDPEWWSKTAFPPFWTCWTAVWGVAPEPAECPECGKDITGVVADVCPHCGGDLRTRPCPHCKGRGFFPEGLGPKWTAALSAAGLVCLVFGFLLQGFSPCTEILFVFGGMLLIVGISGAIPGSSSRREPCTACEETGWWDPRGRAQRRIPDPAA